MAAEDGDRPSDERIEDLLEGNLPDLHAYVRLRIGADARRRETSLDIVQSVCADVLQYRQRFQHGGAEEFRHWLFRTAKRKILNRHAFWQAERRSPEREATGLAPEAAEQLLGPYASVCTPSRAASAREQIERLEQAFDQLSERHRDVILEARVLGRSREEMARERGLSNDALRALLARAMTSLAAEFARSGG